MDAELIPHDRWATLLILLSLDGVVPFYEDMGLPHEDAGHFREVVRDTITENRRLWEADPGLSGRP